MRLIDADEFAEEVASSMQDDFHPHTKIAINSFAKWISEQPTVDAVEVVRCKNCQKCYYDEEWKAYVAKPGCPLKPIGFGCARIEPDGYCSRGVRKEEQT